MKIGLIADLHYTPWPGEWQGRHCNDALDRLGEFIHNTSDCDFIINLGDIINGCPSAESDLASLLRVRDIFKMLPMPTYHVLGNHDVTYLPKDAIITALSMPASDYSFLRDGVRFIVLDSNYTDEQRALRKGYGSWTESYITDSRLNWLRQVLSRNDFKFAVVICHQCLDERPAEYKGSDPYAIGNAAEVRYLLEQSGKVQLVLNGHCHEGRMRPINNIMYFTQPSICETEYVSYGILTIDPQSRRMGVLPHGNTAEVHM